MTDKQKAEWDLFSRDDPSFRSVVYREKEKRRWEDPPRLSYPELQEARQILEDEEGQKRLEEAGVLITRPKTSKIVKRSQERADRAILCEEEANWSSGEQMTRKRPLNEASLLPRRVPRVKKVSAVVDSRTDEEILSAGEKNWNLAESLTNPARASEAIDERIAEAAAEEEVEEFSEDFSEEVELTPENRDIKIDRLDQRIEKLSSDGVAEGDWETKLRFADLVESLKVQKLELQGSFTD